MCPTLPDRFHATQRKMRVDPREPDHKPLVDDRRWLGRIVEDALELIRMTKQDAAYRLGYRDQSAVSRWIAGIEHAPIARLFRVLGPNFQRAFAHELLRRTPGVELGAVARFTVDVEGAA